MKRQCGRTLWQVQRRYADFKHLRDALVALGGGGSESSPRGITGNMESLTAALAMISFPPPRGRRQFSPLKKDTSEDDAAERRELEDWANGVLQAALWHGATLPSSAGAAPVSLATGASVSATPLVMLCMEHH